MSLVIKALADQLFLGINTHAKNLSWLAGQMEEIHCHPGVNFLRATNLGIWKSEERERRSWVSLAQSW